MLNPVSKIWGPSHEVNSPEGKKSDPWGGRAGVFTTPNRTASLTKKAVSEEFVECVKPGRVFSRPGRMGTSTRYNKALSTLLG